MGSYEDIIYRGDNFISLDVQMHTDSDNIPSQKILHLFTSILKMYYILNLMLVFLNYTFINLITLREYKYIFMHNFLKKIFYIFYFIVQKKDFWYRLFWSAVSSFIRRIKTTTICRLSNMSAIPFRTHKKENMG